MSDSVWPDHLDANHDRDREQRIAAIKRWVAYLQSEPPEVWGPQQNAVVNGQLTAAQHVATSAAHQQHVAAVAAEIRAAREDNAAAESVSPDDS
ncbi:hypothetical protein [Halorubrum distributum]|uniref:Uncharacterized protein n=1 Tax=Halorubrum distributum JCM 10247 TaxID=1227486 RepID=M0DI05_9EURY|nr:hypothetical protein [Halorubrum terrestre]ELZ33814.1 hypothetical protein C473_07040 [Halorubrum terrestre JCM 10247]